MTILIERSLFMAVAKDQIRQIITENNITSVADVYSLLKDSFKDILQELLEAEMDATLGYEKNCKGDLKSDNKRNGHSSKTLKSQYGEFQIDVPRDRNGEFEPKLIPKYQRDISGIEEKVISLYARGMSTRDIHDQLQELYGIELSAEMVSKITDKILPEVKEWQSRPLNLYIPSSSWTASIIKSVKTAGSSAVLRILYWELPWKATRRFSVLLWERMKPVNSGWGCSTT